MNKSRTVLVGAFNMTRLAEEMVQDTVTFAFPGFRPRDRMVQDVTEKLL
jgi:hypothetical protein